MSAGFVLVRGHISLHQSRILGHRPHCEYYQQKYLSNTSPISSQNLDCKPSIWLWSVQTPQAMVCGANTTDSVCYQTTSETFVAAFAFVTNIIKWGLFRIYILRNLMNYVNSLRMWLIHAGRTLLRGNALVLVSSVVDSNAVQWRRRRETGSGCELLFIYSKYSPFTIFSVILLVVFLVILPTIAIGIYCVVTKVIRTFICSNKN